MIRDKQAAARLTSYYLQNPVATAAQAARATNTSWHQAKMMLLQRATPIEEYINKAAAAEGRKDDTGKLPWHLLPPDAIGEILKVLQFGAEKYGERNWEYGMAWSRPFSALMRHMWAWQQGEDTDGESGLSHLAHAGCCLLFLLAYELREVGVDDRE